MYTQLDNRVLWYDGDITVAPSSVLEFIKYADKLFASELSDDVIQYNKLVRSKERITVKDKLSDIDKHWNIPDEYKNIDMFEWVLQKLQQSFDNNELTRAEYDDRLERAMVEFKEFKRLNLFPLLRTLIYIINTFESNDVVWGPGRGSSVSSYILYLIGVHDVDSVTYELDISDFMKDIQ